MYGHAMQTEKQAGMRRAMVELIDKFDQAMSALVYVQKYSSKKVIEPYPDGIGHQVHHLPLPDLGYADFRKNHDELLVELRDAVDSEDDLLFLLNSDRHQALTTAVWDATLV